LRVDVVTSLTSKRDGLADPQAGEQHQHHKRAVTRAGTLSRAQQTALLVARQRARGRDRQRLATDVRAPEPETAIAGRASPSIPAPTYS